MSERRDELTEGRVREAFSGPEFDEGRAERMLAEVERARAAKPSVWLRSVPIALAIAVTVMLVVALWPGWLTLPGQRPSPGMVIGRALAAVDTEGRVLHLVVTSVSRQYEPPRDTLGRESRGRIEIWQDAERGWRRTDRSVWKASGWQDAGGSATRDGIVTSIQTGETPTGTVLVNVLKYDASVFADERRGDPMLQRSGADLDVYRELLRSGEATFVGSTETSGVPTYRLRLETRGFDEGTQTLFIDVRRSDYLPVLVRGSEWYIWEGKRVVWREWTTTYEVAEALSRDRVPDGAFDLDIPPGLPVMADYALTPTKAVSHEGIRGWWLGREYDGLSLANGELRYESGPRRKGGYFTDLFALANAGRPQLDTRSVTAEYGSGEGRDVQVVSFPLVSTSKWQQMPVDTTETVRVDGESALLGEYTVSRTRNGVGEGGGTMRWLILDKNDATVLLQGWNVSRDELIVAASHLRHVEP